MHTDEHFIEPFVPGSLPTDLQLPSNLRERQIRDVPEPSYSRPSDEEFYAQDPLTGERKPNGTFLKHHFYQEGRLTEEQALFVLNKATDMLSREPNMVDVRSPVTICGDIHGQYYDLMKLFEVGGSLVDNSYLFLGDYVDRGCFGIECLLYLYTLKLWYPDKFVLLRGNHECRHLTEYFTFQRECLHKYSTRVYEACIKSFCALPIAALVDGRFFCVHGGISPELVVLEDLHHLNRFREPGSDGLLCDLLWADPIANFGHEQEHSVHGPSLPPGTTFLPNSTRGCSFYFTYDAACEFLARNKLLSIIRGHEAQDAGYTMHRKTPTKKFPSVITIFSAPNYLDVYHNRGAVLKYANKNITIRQYNSTAHPYWLPNFMDAFTWSLPFVGAKITEMLLAILSICSKEELVSDTWSDDEEGSDTRSAVQVPLTPSEISQRRTQIKNKILAVGKMQRLFQSLREEAENATEFQTGLDPEEPGVGLRLGPDALGVQGNEVRRNIRSFDEARKFDIVNERLPDFDPSASTGIFPAPSMRVPKRVLEGDDDRGGYVDEIADRLAEVQIPYGKPRPLKRFETA